jgi:hypothetical protein
MLDSRDPVMVKDYIHQPVGLAELSSLVILAEAEEDSFFQRNPHLLEPYRERLVAIALCQGAALQYLGCGYGVHDFDLHFFYQQNPDKPRLSRTVKRIWATVGAFNNVPVDFIRTVIPWWLYTGQSHGPVELLRAFLGQPPTANAWHLAQKAVIGLIPQELFSMVVWPHAAV